MSRRADDLRFPHVPTVRFGAWAILNATGEMVRGLPEHGFAAREVLLFGSEAEAIEDAQCVRSVQVEVTVMPSKTGRRGRHR